MTDDFTDRASQFMEAFRVAFENKINIDVSVWTANTGQKVMVLKFSGQTHFFTLAEADRLATAAEAARDARKASSVRHKEARNLAAMLRGSIDLIQQRIGALQ